MHILIVVGTTFGIREGDHMVEAHSGTRRISPRGGARAGEEQEEWEENEIFGGGVNS